MAADHFLGGLEMISIILSLDENNYLYHQRYEIEMR